jgi:hypothetical protein
MSKRYPTSLLRLLFLSVIILVPTFAHAQAVIKVNDNVSLRFGVLLQGWIDQTQDPASQDYAKSIFLRRMRFLVGGAISPNISFFFETDNPNLGRTTAANQAKALGAGFITQDAFVEWKPMGTNTFMIDGGLMLIPLCRNCLESAGTLLSLDYGSFSFNQSAATQSSVGRDTGVQFKGYFNANRFEYRAGVFEGFRTTALAKNSLRFVGHLNYNFWDPEAPGYTYAGHYLGNKKVLAVGAGIDHQDDYKGYSVDGFISLPMGGGPSGATTTGQTGAPPTTPPPAPAATHNALNAELTLLNFNGDTTFSTLKKQNDATLQAGYYLAGVKLMPWIRFEKQDIKNTSTGDNKRQQLGLTYYPAGHNFNIKGAYSHIDPTVGNKSNEYTVQMQFFYY